MSVAILQAAAGWERAPANCNLVTWVRNIVSPGFAFDITISCVTGSKGRGIVPKVAASRHIATPPTSLWDLMSRVDLRANWDLSVKQFHRSGRDDDLPNMRLRYRAPLIFGLFWEWEGAYVTYKPPHRTAVQMVNGSRLRPFKRLAGSWILSEESGGTRLELIVQFESRLPIAAKLMSPMIKRILERSLVRLEELASGRSHP